MKEAESWGKTSAWLADAMETVIVTYGNRLYKRCLMMPKNPSDAENIIHLAEPTGADYTESFHPGKN